VTVLNHWRLSTKEGRMDIASVIRHRLEELGIGQRDLAVAAEVTESYISQLLAKKKNAARLGSDRHLRQDRQSSETSRQGTGESG